MATNKNPSGFYGNLSADQETKLQQLWTILLKCLEASSGVEGPVNRRKSSISRTESNISARPSTASSSADTTQLTETLQGIGLDATQIKTIRQSLANMNTEELHRGFLASVKNEHPDVLMLRYLRARKWDVGNAFAMMVGGVEWRIKDMHVEDEVLTKGELHALKQSKNTANATEKKNGEDFLAQSRVGKAFIRGVDKSGRPIVAVRVRLHQPGAQSQEVLNQFIVHTIESARLLLRSPVETAAVLFDMTGFSLSNMEYPPVKFIIQCFEANYPESLGVMLIHNAPWIFSGIWRLIKGWMDPVIVSKVQFTRSAKDLEQFIPRETIYKELGGPDDWEPSFIEPTENENDRLHDTTTRDAIIEDRQKIVKDLLAATSAWISATSSKDSEQVKATQAQREDFMEQLRVNYWKLDPYVRARNHLDRAGIVQEGGKIDFFPKPGVKVSKGLEVEEHETVPANTTTVSA